MNHVLLLSLVLFFSFCNCAAPLFNNATCNLGRSTWYEVTTSGSCGYDTISNFQFDLLFGVAPNEDFYFGSAQCGECYQVIGPYGARSTDSTSPAPTVLMVADYCPKGDNARWCSGDMTHFDMRYKAWDAFIKGDRNAEPYLFTFQRIPCPFTTSGGSSVSLQIVDINQWYLSLRPFYQNIPIQDTLLIKESGMTSFAVTSKRTSYNEYQYSNGQGIKYPITVRVTALRSAETIDITIQSAPSKGSTASSGKQFSLTPGSVVQSSPVQNCKYYMDPVVYDDVLHRNHLDTNHVTGDDWRIYGTSYVAQSTAVPAKTGSYVLQSNYAGWGTLQIARKTPVYKSDVTTLLMDVRAATNGIQISLSLNGAGGTAGASNNKFITLSTSWQSVSLSLTTADIPNEITIIYTQLQQASGATVYFDNIRFTTPSPVPAPSPKASPKPSPKPSPRVSPKVSAAPKTSPKVSPKPALSPKVSPKVPKISPRVSPKASVKQSPRKSPSPTKSAAPATSVIPQTSVSPIADTSFKASSASSARFGFGAALLFVACAVIIFI